MAGDSLLLHGFMVLSFLPSETKGKVNTVTKGNVYVIEDVQYPIKECVLENHALFNTIVVHLQHKIKCAITWDNGRDLERAYGLFSIIEIKHNNFAMKFIGLTTVQELLLPILDWKTALGTRISTKG